MTERIHRRRRCQLPVPASSVGRIEHALSLGADHVFLDLEDSVAPTMKFEARRNVITAFNEMDWGRTVRCFRMNGLDRAWAYQDLITVVEAAGRNIDTLMIPGVKHVRDLHFVDTFLTQIEQKIDTRRKIGLELLIEDAQGIANVTALALASPRVEALIFGATKYARTPDAGFRECAGEPHAYPGDIWHHQRSAIANAARVAGADYVDGPCTSLTNPDAYDRECRMVRALGAVGKWVEHPSQIPIAINAFSPSRQEIADALRYLAELDVVKTRGIGTVTAIDGRLLDIATVPLLEAIVAQAEFFGLEIPEAACQPATRPPSAR
ncbi:CoA ester lyase [Burkholderia sp. D-99]|uniref:aldolase/citrate lyase family protein n=1 Tax=Burkholderia sp. D-99 TaxID=2717316 RepID=UPI00141D8ACD|nr:CoA ester lyase [Burkholderia sp. D-99]